MSSIKYTVSECDTDTSLSSISHVALNVTAHYHFTTPTHAASFSRMRSTKRPFVHLQSCVAVDVIQSSAYAVHLSLLTAQTSEGRVVPCAGHGSAESAACRQLKRDIVVATTDCVVGVVGLIGDRSDDVCHWGSPLRCRCKR